MTASAAESSAYLRAAIFAPATHRAYNNSFQSFLHFSGLQASRLRLMRPQRIDQLLCRFIGELHHTGRPHSTAVHALSGLVHYLPRLRQQLPEARLRIRGWARRKVTTSHPPITWELTLVIALTMAQFGHHAEAIACLLSFDCYLRVGEMTRLRFKDIIIPHDARMGKAHIGMALRLPKTKTGLNQWVSLHNDRVSSLLFSWFKLRRRAGARSHDKVFPFSPDHFRHLLRRVADSVGLGSTAYVPHSFRHGGATTDNLLGHSIEQIMFRGRWRSMDSARRYIQTGRALLAAQRVPRRVHRQVSCMTLAS